MQDFTNLKVWQKAHTLTVNIYKATSGFPSEEKAEAKLPSRLTTICAYALRLISQIRRASVSIESNLAEGCGRNSDKEFARFVSIAQGSAFEVRCQLMLAKDLGYMPAEKFDLFEQKISEVNRMLNVLNQKLRAKS
ncbi:MAG: four helix bundle protein [Cyanobacteria bacterium J06555_3]